MSESLFTQYMFAFQKLQNNKATDSETLVMVLEELSDIWRFMSEREQDHVKFIITAAAALGS